MTALNFIHLETDCGDQNKRRDQEKVVNLKGLCVKRVNIPFPSEAIPGVLESERWNGGTVERNENLFMCRNLRIII